MNWKLRFWKDCFSGKEGNCNQASAVDHLIKCDYDTRANVLKSNLRHLEFIDFYEGHLRSREQTEFIQDQLESLEFLKNDIKHELVILYSNYQNLK